MTPGLASPRPAMVHPPFVGEDDGQTQPPAEGEAAPLDEKARRRAEVESFLGPSVRAPGGLPDGYIPNDRSIHPIFHVDLSTLEFSGPLDLLLYLIRRHQLDILDIPIAFVTEKYLEMLQSLEALEIDVAAEFLVLAAELTHIKSKMLLPADEGVGVEDPPEETEAGDPRAELIRRLLEYQKYRDAAGQLADRDRLGRDVFPRHPPTLEPVDDLDPGLKQISVFRLVELMARLLREAPVHHEISYESFSIGERIQFVSAFGEAHEGRFTILSLMSRIESRGELVVTFIALLEMAKMGLVRILSEVFHDSGRAGPKARATSTGSEGEASTESPAGSEEGVSSEGSENPMSSEGSESSVSVEGAESSVSSEGSESRVSSEGSESSVSSEGIDVSSEDGGSPSEAPDAAAAEPIPGSGPEAEPPPERADLEDEAAAAHREAAALEALAEEAAGAEALGADAIDLPEASLEAPPAEPLEPLPEIWVELTEKRFQGDLVDDYR